MLLCFAWYGLLENSFDKKLSYCAWCGVCTKWETESLQTWHNTCVSGCFVTAILVIGSKNVQPVSRI